MAVPGRGGSEHPGARGTRGTALPGCTAATAAVFPLLRMNGDHWDSGGQRTSKHGLISPVLAEMLGCLGDS